MKPIIRTLTILASIIIVILIVKTYYPKNKTSSDFNSMDIFHRSIANSHPSPDTISKNDLIHPSIAYIPNGLGSTGSKWG